MSISIKIDHVAIMVSDLEKSLHFYRDLLGLEVVSPEEHIDGPISEMTAMPKVHMREYRLRAPGGIHGHTRNDGPGFTFDLIQWLNPPSPCGAISPQPCAERAYLFRRGGCSGHVRTVERSGRGICLPTRSFQRRR